MTNNKYVKLSKKMSYALRHEPEQFNITIDKEGYVDLMEFSQKLKIAVEDIKKVVETSEKNRFSILDGKIRANQGHSSKKVELSMEKLFYDDLPEYFYHGTKEKFLGSIQKDGLLPQSRHHVHLSIEEKTAKEVAERRKDQENIIFKIDARELYNHTRIFKSENGVILVEKVPAKLLNIHRKYRT